MENNKVVISYKGLNPTENNSPKFKRIEEAINKEGFGYEIIEENGRIMGIKFNNFYPTKDEIEVFEPPKTDIFKTYVIGVAPYESKPSLKEAIEVLCNALREDKSEGSYYYSWQANIAMSILDEYNRQSKDMDYEEKRSLDMYKICNEGAKNFLNLLISK